MKTLRRTLVLSLLAVLAGAVGGEAQTDGRWTPFYGCWEPAAGASDGGLLCFRPTSDDVGVEMLTVLDGEVVTTEVFRADGKAQQIEREGCTGSETAEFAQDPGRIFTRSLYTCEGDVTRSATGIMSMTAPGQWIDVRAVAVGERPLAWVQFYRTADPEAVEAAGLGDITARLGMAVRSARLAASAPLTVDDVLEAAGKVDAEAVKAWVAERGDRFDLTGDDLLALDDAGVDADLIDVMVAVSNPDYFALEEGGEARAAPTRDPATMRSAWNRFPYGRYYDPFFFDPFYYGIAARYNYAYSPWGWYGGYGGYGGYVPTPIVVRPAPTGGRVVKGRGYTRGTASRGGSGQPAYRGPTSRSSGSSAGVSSSSGSSRSGGSSTGRTARRRGGGL